MTSATPLEFNLVSSDGSRRVTLPVRRAVIAGWTARDVAAMEKHIHELEEIGVPRPTSTPMYYRVGAARITTADSIQTAGGDSSGEVEFIMVDIDGRLWVGAGSDHTDRKVETYGITVAKQMCDKPVAATLWPWDEVAGHWDELILRAHIVEGGKRLLYQEGPVASMKRPPELIDGYRQQGGTFDHGTLMFGGTLAAHGGIRPAGRFEFELADPVLKRSIRHAYNMEPFPIVG